MNRSRLLFTLLFTPLSAPLLSLVTPATVQGEAGADKWTLKDR